MPAKSVRVWVSSEMPLGEKSFWMWDARPVKDKDSEYFSSKDGRILGGEDITRVGDIFKIRPGECVEFEIRRVK